MNKIKTRFVGAALAVVMAATSFNSVFAASSNSITRIDSVKEDSIIENVDLKKKPTSAVESGSSIILSLENAEFDEDASCFFPAIFCHDFLAEEGIDVHACVEAVVGDIDMAMKR